MKYRVKQFFQPLKGNLLVLTTSTLIWTFFQQAIGTYEVLYVFSLGGTGTTLSMITAIQLILGIFLMMLGGYIADIYGRRWIIGIVTTLLSFSYLFYVFAQNWVWILVGSSLLSLTSIYGPALEAIRADSVRPNERGRSFVLLTILPKIPGIISPILGGILIADALAPYGINIQGARTGFLLLFFGMLVSGLIRLFFLRETLFNQTTKHSNYKTIHRRALNEVYTTIFNSGREIKKLILLNGFFMFSFHFGVTFRTAYAVHVKGLSTVQWGLIESISQIIMILTAFIIGDFIDRYGRKKIFIPAISLLGIAALIFAISNNFTYFLFAMSLANIGMMARMMSLQVLIADTIPKTIRGRIMSATNIFGSLGSHGSIMISGFLYDLSPTLPYYISIIMYTLAILVAFKFLKESDIRQL